MDMSIPGKKFRVEFSATKTATGKPLPACGATCKFHFSLVCHDDVPTVYYARYKNLGIRLADNEHGERAIVAERVRAEYELPATCSIAFCGIWNGWVVCFDAQ
jgi:hypothetical protein